MTTEGYAGDVSPQEAWRILGEEPGAALVDVRTDAEWAYVGLTDLAGLGKAPVLIPWQVFPSMAVNANFVNQLASQGVGPEQTVLLLCRSGVRSRAAAIALTSAGYRRCLHVSDGFEGPPDDARHRGGRAGWKASGLPWQQS